MDPSYIYKILDHPPPTPLPPTLPPTALDTKDGFIHLSTASQTTFTAKTFFGQNTRLWILKLAVEALDGRIEWLTDPGTGIVDGCPHLHDSRNGLGSGNVREVVEVWRREGEDWLGVEGLRGLED